MSVRVLYGETEGGGVCVYAYSTVLGCPVCVGEVLCFLGSMLCSDSFYQFIVIGSSVDLFMYLQAATFSIIYELVQQKLTEKVVC